jgi:hypothetical protein
LVQNATGKLLLARQGGTERFMLPVGKSNLARTPLQVLARELREEEPLIFVEVALVKGLATAMAPLLSQDAEGDASRADTATSIPFPIVRTACAACPSAIS